MTRRRLISYGRRCQPLAKSRGLCRPQGRCRLALVGCFRAGRRSHGRPSLYAFTPRPCSSFTAKIGKECLVYAPTAAAAGATPDSEPALTRSVGRPTQFSFSLGETVKRTLTHGLESAIDRRRLGLFADC